MFDFLFDLVVAAFTLAPVGVFVIFWMTFREDLGIHPIYRQSRVETRVAEQEKYNKARACDFAVK